ncbi:hypothetical protein SOVF_108520, partial [Spinacia oleracea]
STQTRMEGRNILGKLQITWRTNLGESGRLQTQHILGSPVPRKEIDLQVVKIPPAIIMHKPFEILFQVQLRLTNQTERALGPFEIWYSGDSNGELAFMVKGLQTMGFDDNVQQTDVGINNDSLSFFLYTPSRL